ncbi:MAG: hypothetical protein HYV27_02790 [Candidatus Hydrogenedentes bacterium]|nr:hypothetical protein [Candidatus Hydrogenedentota bacterium]
MKSSLKSKTFFALLALAALVLPGQPAAAHPVSLSEAEADIYRDRVDVKLKILLEDLYLYQDLKASDEGYLSVATLNEAMEKHKTFVKDFFQIRDLEGLTIAGEVTGMTAQELPEEGVHIANLMQFNVEYLLHFPLADAPKFLTFIQVFGGADSFLPASMWLTLKREGEGMFRPFMLPKDVPYAIDIDWDAPPPPADASPEEASAYFEQENQKKLGFTSYGAVYSFFYITDFEVRHEILIPLLTLESWMPIERRDKAFIEVEEQHAARDAIFAYFRDRNPVEVDGIAVKPSLENIVYYGLDFKDFAQLAPEKRLSAYTARVGIILNYSTKGTPNAVKLTWEMFNNYVPVLYSMIYDYDNTNQKVFTRREPIFEWNNPGREAATDIATLDPPPPAKKYALPVISLGAALLLLPVLPVALYRRRRGPMLLCAALLLAGAAGWPWQPVEIADPFSNHQALSDEEAANLFAALHKNVYRAFDYRIESDVYDALDKSVGGDLLATLYLQIRKGLEMQEQGGAISRIKDVRIVNAEHAPLEGADPARAFAMLCTWQVEGSVEHWGHIHTRTNQYQARFKVEALESGWKITGMDVISEERVKFDTGLRVLPS